MYSSSQMHEYRFLTLHISMRQPTIGATYDCPLPYCRSGRNFVIYWKVIPSASSRMLWKSTEER